MVAVMGERESEGEEERMFTTGNEYDILGEEEEGKATNGGGIERKPQPKLPLPSPSHPSLWFLCSSDELSNWG